MGGTTKSDWHAILSICSRPPRLSAQDLTGILARTRGRTTKSHGHHAIFFPGCYKENRITAIPINVTISIIYSLIEIIHKSYKEKNDWLISNTF